MLLVLPHYNIELLKKKVPNISCQQTLLEDYDTDKKYDNIFFLNVIPKVI